MKGNKFLAAMLAASMAFSTVPVTALNVFASTNVTSETADADAVAFPPTDTVKGWLNPLTASTDSDDLKGKETSDISTTITNKLTGAFAGFTVEDVTEDTAKAQAASTARSFANRTFEITLKNGADNTTRTYTAVLTAEKLTGAEATAILPDYMTEYISTHATIGDKDADLKSDADDAADAFNSKYDVTVTVSNAKFTKPDNGAYTISITAPSTFNVTGTVNFYKDSQVTVKNKTNGNSTGRTSLKNAVLAMNYKPKTNAAGVYDTTAIATAVSSALKNAGTSFVAQNVSVTDADNWSFEAYDSTGTYTVTIGTGADLETDNSALKTALDNYFASNEIKTTKDKTLRNTDIAALVNADADVMKALSSYKITGDGNALGSDGSGKLTITNGTTTYTYAFTADVKVSEETESEANRKALATVNATTYPEYKVDGTVKYDKALTVSHDEALLKNKLLSDLKDAGYNTNGLTVSSFGRTPSKEDADKTTNGEYKTVITPNKDTVDVALTYSSDQKLLDTEKALEKFLAKGSTKSTNATAYTEHKEATGVKLDDVAAPSEEYSFATTSALSQKVQAKSAVKATSAADAADIVKAAVDEQLTAAGVADNGVSVSVKAVNEATAKADDKYDVTAESDATVGAEGEIDLLVSASIKNDFYGWSDAVKTKDTAKTVSYSYLVKIDTNSLKENAAKSITLSDKTVLLSGGYYTVKKSDYQDSDHEVTYVEITPVIDPADANTAVTYKVYDSDNSLVTDEVKVSDSNAVYKKDSNTAVKVGTNALGLKITKAGTYTIKATSGDAEASMKLTVKKSFDDVPATAYYSKAVAWAYTNGITAGTTDSTFGSNNSVTRAQFVTWLYKYAVSEDSSVAISDSDVKSVFSDVATDKYYAKAVQWAVANGVTSGTTSTTFSPDQPITRAQALTMVWHVKGEPLSGQGMEDEVAKRFTDLPSNSVFRKAIVWAVKAKVTSGTTATTVSPDEVCARSQAITFIYNAQ